MKNSYVKKLTIILIATVFSVGAATYLIMYNLSFRAIIGDIQSRTDGIRKHIENSITLDDIIAVGTSAIRSTRDKLMGIKADLSDLAKITQLYIARVIDGAIVTSLVTSDGDYAPTSQMQAAILRSITDAERVIEAQIYNTDHGNVIGVYWAVLNDLEEVQGSICMEYDVDDIYAAYRQMLFFSGGIVLLFIVIIITIARLMIGRTSEDLYKKLAYTDILTGYENRMGFEIVLKQATEKAAQGTPTAIMIFDVNNLKTINDTLGHKTGDLYIKNTADIIASHIAPDKIFRIGGDEFAAIINDKTWTDLKNILSGLQSEKKEVITDYPFNCASGMARYDRTEDGSLKDTFQRADDAMYANKKETKAKKLRIDERELNNIEKLQLIAKQERESLNYA